MIRISMPSRRRHWIDARQKLRSMADAMPDDWVEATARFVGLGPQDAFGCQMKALVNDLE